MLDYGIRVLIIVCYIFSAQAVQAADNTNKQVAVSAVRTVVGNFGLRHEGASMKKIVKNDCPNSVEYRVIYPDGHSKVARFYPLRRQYVFFVDSSNSAINLKINQHYRNFAQPEQAFHYYRLLFEQAE